MIGLRHLVAISCAMLAMPALAQTDDPQIGSRLEAHRTIDVEQNRAASIRASHSFASCLVNRRRTLALQYLRALDPNEVRRIEPSLFREVRCANIPGMSEMAERRRLSVSPDIQRGTLAEALLERDPATLPPALPLDRTYASRWHAVSSRDQLVEEMAVCVAATNPGAIAALMRSAPETDDERAALTVLLPQLGPCLQSNARLTANRPSLRAALAEALFHRIDESWQPAAGVEPR